MITAFIYLLIGSVVLIMAFFAWIGTDNGQIFRHAISNCCDTLSNMTESEYKVRIAERKTFISQFYMTYKEVSEEYKRLKELRG